ncbi:MAG: TolC family protein [Nevskiales bacterium]|nr:TolC family protein [Nevskiales bacterium]
MPKHPFAHPLIRAAAAVLIACAPHAPVSAAATTEATLDAYIGEALAANPDLIAANLGVEASREAAHAAAAQQWPSLALNARYTRADGGRTIDFPAGDLLNGVYQTLNADLEAQGQPAAFPTIENQSIALLREREQETKLSLTAPLFAPSLWAQADAAEALAQAASAGREAYARILVREVKRAYYGATQAEAAVQILEASEALLAENVRVSEALVRTGKATRDRALRAEAERLAVVQRLDAARALAAQTRRLLNALRDQPAEAPIELPEPARLEAPRPEPGEGATRPELLQIDRSIHAAAAQRRAATGTLLPTLALAADYGVEGTRYGFGADDDFNTVSLVLSWSLWDFGSRSAQRRQAIARTDQLKEQRRSLERQLELARRAADDDLQTALRSITAAQARVVAAEEAFRIAQRKRSAASLSQVEFLDSERAVTEARLNLAVARCTALDRAAAVELTRASFPLPSRLATSE